MTRKEAANIALTEIKKNMLEYGEDAIYVALPQPGKNTWTWKEAYESVMNDTCLENTKHNIIDSILKFHFYVEYINI